MDIRQCGEAIIIGAVGEHTRHRFRPIGVFDQDNLECPAQTLKNIDQYVDVGGGGVAVVPHLHCVDRRIAYDDAIERVPPKSDLHIRGFNGHRYDGAVDHNAVEACLIANLKVGGIRRHVKQLEDIDVYASVDVEPRWCGDGIGIQRHNAAVEELATHVVGPTHPIRHV